MKKLNSLEIIILFATVSVIVTFNPLSFDPYNSIKLFFLVFFGIILFVNFIFKYDFTRIYQTNKSVTLISGIFLLLLALSTFVNSDNITQSLLGSYGRNNGFLSWVSLILFFLIASYSRNQIFAHIFIRYFLVIGLILGLYAWSQYAKFDLIKILYPWFNQSGRIDATFGNTNLFAVFSAFVIIISFGLILDRTVNNKIRIFSIFTLGIYLPFIPIIDFQGRILSIFGLMLLLIIWLIFHESRAVKSIGFLFFAGLFIGSAFVVLSFFKIGPLVSYMADYIPSLRDRVFFWEAALRIITDFPLFGVGIDEMNYWYREYRSPDSVGYRGPVGEGADNVHNIFLQLGATTGFFTLIALIFMFIYIGICCAMVLKNYTNNFSQVAIVVAWIIFFLQALISFDNLAILFIGFVFSGILVSLSRMTSKSKTDEVFVGLKKNKNGSPIVISKVIAILIALYQLIIVSAYQVNDLSMHSNWRVIKNTVDGNQQVNQVAIDKFIGEVLRSQQSGKRMRSAEQILIYGQAIPALKIAEITAKEFPREIQAWNTMARILEGYGKYGLATNARKQLVKLDPLNPELKVKLDENIRNRLEGLQLNQP